jgi:hypothetical protein
MTATSCNYASVIASESYYWYYLEHLFQTIACRASNFSIPNFPFVDKTDGSFGIIMPWLHHNRTNGNGKASSRAAALRTAADRRQLYGKNRLIVIR